MSIIHDDNGNDDATASIVIQELAGVADKAFVTGDYSRCVAIVENIYELLDRRSMAATSQHRREAE